MIVIQAIAAHASRTSVKERGVYRVVGVSAPVPILEFVSGRL